VKNLKLGILACGAVLLVVLLTDHIVDSLKEDALNTILVLVGAAVPTLLGLLGLARPPFQQWQSVASLAGFGLVAVKFRIWETLPHIAKMATKEEVEMIAIVVGIVISAIAIARPEEHA
jgi:hypothetical protein